MNEYIKIGTFYHKTNLFQLLIDEKNKFYFLKINNGNYSYPTLKEYVQLLEIFSDNENIRAIEINNLNEINNKNKKKKIRIIPKVLIGATAVALSLAFLTSLDMGRPIDKSLNYTSYVNTSTCVEETIDLEMTKTEEAIQKYLEEIAKDKEIYGEKTYTDNLGYVKIYDSVGLDQYYNTQKEDVTYDMIREAIRNNPNIPDRMKTVFYVVVDNAEKKYPTLDLRIWYKNLQTLNVVELNDEYELQIETLSVNASACYNKMENTIYTLKEYDYTPGTWEYQVIVHEIGHTMRLHYSEEDDKTIKTSFTNERGNIIIVEEALNSLFTLRLYDENEMDIAYQLQSNMVELMVNSMDNYTYQDYIENDINYFVKMLNEHNKDDNAIEMLHLLNLQYKDFHDSNIDVMQEEYYPLYDYIAKMYYDANITPDMSREQIEQVHQNFIYKLTYDVPEEYNIDLEHINQYFQTYCYENGINYTITK